MKTQDYILVLIAPPDTICMEISIQTIITKIPLGILNSEIQLQKGNGTSEWNNSIALPITGMHTQYHGELLKIYVVTYLAYPIIARVIPREERLEQNKDKKVGWALTPCLDTIPTIDSGRISAELLFYQNK